MFYIYPSKCTYIAVNTHTYVNTHPEQWADIYATVPGELLGVWCLAQGHLVVVLKVERALYIHSPHRQSLPDRDSNLQPFDYESDSLPLGHDFPQPVWEVHGSADRNSECQNICHKSCLNYKLFHCTLKNKGFFFFFFVKNILVLLRTFFLYKEPFVQWKGSLDVKCFSSIHECQ